MNGKEGCCFCATLTSTQFQPPYESPPHWCGAAQARERNEFCLKTSGCCFGNDSIPGTAVLLSESQGTTRVAAPASLDVLASTPTYRDMAAKKGPPGNFGSTLRV